MNGVPTNFEGSMTMKADGTWYVNRIGCGDETVAGWAAKIHIMMQEAERILFQHNSAEKLPEKEKK